MGPLILLAGAEVLLESHLRAVSAHLHHVDDLSANFKTDNLNSEQKHPFELTACKILAFSLYGCGCGASRWLPELL